MSQNTNHISTVRQALLDTIRDLRDPTNPMDIARAHAVSEVAQTVINAAKVEVDFLKVTGQTNAAFLDSPPQDQPPRLTVTKPAPGEQNGILSIVQHRLQG